MLHRRGWRPYAAGLAIITTTGLGLSACGSSTKPSANNSASTTAGATAKSNKGAYTILYSGDFSGATQTYTKAEVAGLNIAASEINGNGGIDGRQVKVITQDDQNNPTTAVSLLSQKLSSGTKIDAMYPGGSSEVSQALLPITTRDKILTIDATSDPTLNNPAKYPYHFGDSESVAQTIPPFIQLAQKKGWKNVAIIYGNDTTGQAVQSGYASALQAVGIKTESAAYDDTALDMTPQLETLKSASPDALIISSYGTPSLYVLKSRAQMGWTTTPAFGDLITSALPVASLLPKATLTNYYAQASETTLASNPDATNDPAMQKMISDAKAAGDTKVLSGVGAGLLAVGFNVPVLIAQAAKQAGATDTVSVAKALESLQQPSGPYPPWLVYFGKYGGFNFTAQNHFPTVNVANFTFIPPGTNNADGLLVPGGPAYS